MSNEKAKAKQIQVVANDATPAGSLQELIETRKILPTATTTLDGAMSKEDKAKLEDLPSNSELTTALSGKVDKVSGKGLSTNDYSNADKAKLASLESSHFRGVYVNEAALATIPDPIAGDYADVDAGTGSDAERWIYDVSDSKWIIQGSATSVTASQVKQLYESNSDTNAFTDTEKTKLSALPTNQTLTTQLDAKADKTTQVIAGTGLSGGGTLAANRTLSVNYGTTEGTAAEGNDSRLSNSREWTAGTISQAEAEAGTATTRRAFTAQRVRQAIVAWFNGISGALGRTILSRTTAAEVRGDIGLGNASTRDVGTASGTVAAGDDARLTNSREWTASVVSQAEAEAGTATTARKWTAQRVAQAINALGLKIGTTATTAKAGNWMPTWANVTGKPTEFTPSSHTHSLSEVTDVGDLAAINTNASTSNFLRGDGTWVTPPNTNTVTSVRANNTGTYRTGNININGGTNVTVTEGAAGQFTIAATNTNTTYSAGSGLSLSGTTFSLPVTVSGTGSYVQSVTQGTNGLTVTLGTPPNTNTTYTEITTAIIDAGTSSALHTISGRRMKYALDKKADAIHAHDWSDITHIPEEATRWPTFAEVADKPSSFTPSSHTHASGDITGLGNAATRNVGTASGTVAAGDDSRIKGAIQSSTISNKTVRGGLKTHLDGTTLYMRSDNTDIT